MRMPSMPSYNQFRQVLNHYGFRKKREGKRHEVWEKVTPERVFLVFASRKRSETIATTLFHQMLDQAGLTEAEFRAAL